MRTLDQIRAEVEALAKANAPGVSLPPDLVLALLDLYDNTRLSAEDPELLDAIGRIDAWGS